MFESLRKPKIKKKNKVFRGNDSKEKNIILLLLVMHRLQSTCKAKKHMTIDFNTYTKCFNVSGFLSVPESRQHHLHVLPVRHDT